VLDADQIRDVRCVPRDVVGRGRARADEHRHAGHADHAAGRRAGADLLVGDVAAMLDQRERIGMAEDHRPCGRRHDIEAAAAARVRAVHQQAGIVDGRDDALAERREPARDVVAAVGHAVVAVVREVDLAHAEVAVERDGRRLLHQRHGAFEVEADRELAARLRPLDRFHAVRQHVAVGMRGDPRAEPGDHRQDLRDRIHVHADVERDVIDAGRAVGVERREVRARMQRQARVGFPLDHRRTHWCTLGAARLPSERDQFALGAALRAHAGAETGMIVRLRMPCAPWISTPSMSAVADGPVISTA
jgi:hypothetical protein